MVAGGGTGFDIVKLMQFLSQQDRGVFRGIDPAAAKTGVSLAVTLAVQSRFSSLTSPYQPAST